MRFWNTAAFGKCLCWMGLLLGAWTAAERLTAASVLAEVSGCTVFRSGDSTVVVYAEGEMRMSCTATYEHGGRAVTARLEARLPSDFDAGRASRHAYISVSPLNSRVARLSNQPFDWSSPAAEILALESIGALLILKGRR